MQALRKPEQRRYRALCLHGALWVLVGGLLVSGAYGVSAAPVAAGDVGRLPACQALQGTGTVTPTQTGTVTVTVTPTITLSATKNAIFGSSTPAPSFTPARVCSRMPDGEVPFWEEELLTVAALSEIKYAETWVDEETFQTLAYSIAWVILNRISSPCRTGSLAQVERIYQAAFSGTAIRNLGVYGPALSETAMRRYLQSNQEYSDGQAIYNYLHISPDAAQEYVDYVVSVWIPSTVGLTNAPDEAKGLQKVREPVARALEEWCSGQDGPGIAHNVIYYATAQNRDRNTGVALYNNPMTEIHNQLAYLELLDDGGSCDCQFGWAGPDNEQSALRIITACENTLEVEISITYDENPRVYTERRLRGVELASQYRILY